MTKRHVVRTPIDINLLKELQIAGEIQITNHGHILGLEECVKRLWNEKKKRGGRK
jgi:hypothetical protein